MVLFCTANCNIYVSYPLIPAAIPAVFVYLRVTHYNVFYLIHCYATDCEELNEVILIGNV